MPEKIYDLMIIGAGPAGMTAGVFAARKGLKTVLISKDLGGQVNWTTDIENYMGFEEIDGQALMEKFQDKVKETKLEEKLTEVKSLKKEGELFKAWTVDGTEYQSKTVLVSTGKHPKTLNVPGEAEFRNKGVSYCSTCDAPLFKGVPVVIVGGGDSGVKSVLDLSIYASEIHLITLAGITADQALAERLQKMPQLKQYLQHKVVEIKGSQTVESVVVEDTQSKTRFELKVEGVFIEIGLETNADFLEQVQLNQAQEIQIDANCQTNIPGLYAAGDVTSVPEKQIIVAAGEGAKAALKAWEYLMRDSDKRILH